MNLRIGTRLAGLAATLSCALLVACGGGGGGGGGTLPSTSQNNPSTPTPAPTIAPTAQATTAALSATSPTTVALGGISSNGTNSLLSASLSLPPAGSAGVTAGIDLTSAAPSGVSVPNARTIHAKHAQALGIQNTIAYFAVRFSSNITISQSLGFTLTLPSAVSGNWYVLFDDPSNVLTTGWTDIAPLTLGSGGTSLTLAPTTLSPPITLTANTWYYFAISSTGSAPIQTPPPGAVTLIQATSNVARGTLQSPLGGAIAAALSDAPDYAPNQTLARTTIGVGAGTQAQARLAQLLSPLAYRTNEIAGERVHVEARPPDDKAVMNLVARMRRAGAASRVAAARVRQTLTVGSTMNIWVAEFAIGTSSTTFVSVPATLEAQTAHGNVWIDNTLLTDTSGPFTAGGATTAANTVGTDFENAYASDTVHFGTPNYAANSPGMQTVAACDSTGNLTGASTNAFITEPADQRINVVVLNSSHLGSGVGGYFSSINYVTQAALNCNNSATTQYYSNEMPMIYVGYFDTNPSNFELNEDLVRGTAHEFQHLINFVNHGLLSSTPNSEETALNEGLSMLAQDLAVPRLYPAASHDSLDALQHAAAYLQHPENYSVSGFVGIDQASWGGDGSSAHFNCGGGCYGSAFMFMRYLYDRCGGDAFASSMETSGKSGWANLQSSCNTTESGNQLLEDFAMALAVSQLGIAPPNAKYYLGSLDVNGKYASSLSAYQGTTLPGLGRFTIGANASGSAQAPVGGFAFFDLSSASGAFSLTDTSPTTGFTLLGGLAQH